MLLTDSSPDTKALLKGAEALLYEAEFVEDAAARRDMLVDAKDMLIRAEFTEAGSGAWLLACVAARLGQESLCQKWLERGAKRGSLPPRISVEQSPYMKPLADKSWFKKLFG